jgi:hypothetical protein
MDDGERLRDPRDVAYGELPELTRTLRALGSPRRSSGALQAQFFLPLLEARRRAAEGLAPAASVGAFDATNLRMALDRALQRILEAWPDTRPSARRALLAELGDRVEPYRLALDTLRERATDVLGADEERRLGAWREWTAQLAATFHAADRSWLALRSVIDSLPSKPSV